MLYIQIFKTKEKLGDIKDFINGELKDYVNTEIWDDIREIISSLEEFNCDESKIDVLMLDVDNVLTWDINSIDKDGTEMLIDLFDDIIDLFLGDYKDLILDQLDVVEYFFNRYSDNDDNLTGKLLSLVFTLIFYLRDIKMTISIRKDISEESNN